MQQRVYECSMNSVDKLKLRLDVWNSLHQNVIDAAINDCRKQLRACMHADGQHFEHLLREWVTDKSYGQIKYKYLKKTLLYLWTCDFRGFKVSQGKVRTINRWGGMSDHLWWHIYSAVFLEKNYCNRTTNCWNYRWWLGGILFLRHGVFYPVVSSVFLFFYRLFSAVADWISSKLPHMIWS